MTSINHTNASAVVSYTAFLKNTLNLHSDDPQLIGKETGPAQFLVGKCMTPAYEVTFLVMFVCMQCSLVENSAMDQITRD